MAGALGLRLAGPIAYDGVMHDKSWIGDGTSNAGGEDINRALAVYRRACLLLWLIVTDDPPGIETKPQRESLRQSVTGIWEVVRTPSIGRVFLVQMTCYPSFVLVVGLWGGPYLTHIYGYDLAGRGEILFVAALTQVLGAFVWGPSDRIFGRYKAPVLLGTAMSFVALVLLALLIGTVVTGPLWWRVDPSQQFLNQTWSPPIGSREAILVDGLARWQPEPEITDAVTDVRIVSSNTEFVRLVWPKVDNAARYRVYRTQHARKGSLGLPLSQLPATQTWFQDRLNLAPRTYRYSVLADDANGIVLREFHMETKPQLAMTFYAAQLGSLVPADAIAADFDGKRVDLPAHPLGTDHLGRDILARLLSVGQTSLFIGLMAPLVYVLLGMLYGATSALIGGRIDAVMMNFVDFVVALPFLLFMILFRVAMGTGPGESGITAMLVAMVALGWPSPARLVRGQILKLRELPYVEAARLMGVGRGYLIMRHLLPNVTGSLLVTFTFAIPSAIFTEAFLSFIGMGVVPPAASWGSMCNDGLRSLLTYPHMMLFPALAISLTVLVFNLLGDALRDAMALHDHE